MVNISAAPKRNLHSTFLKKVGWNMMPTKFGTLFSLLSQGLLSSRGLSLYRLRVSVLLTNVKLSLYGTRKQENQSIMLLFGNLVNLPILPMVLKKQDMRNSSIKRQDLLSIHIFQPQKFVGSLTMSKEHKSVQNAESSSLEPSIHGSCGS